MSIFEWFGERYNPGPMGGVELRDGESHGRSPMAVILRLVLSLGLLGLAGYLIFGTLAVEASLKSVATTLGCTALYLTAGFFLRPDPDFSNVGWLGGLFDHPFRFSDDINRFLIFLKILLLPGTFVAESLVESVLLLKSLTSYQE